MGHQSGSGEAVRAGGATRWQWIWAAVLLGSLTGCVVSPSPRKAASSTVRERRIADTPQMLVRSFYGSPDNVKAMTEELADVARPVRGWTRVGNGAVSLRFVDERRRPLETLECGGQLLVEGNPGQSYSLMVRNETDVPLEVLPMVDGLDLETGLAASLSLPGRQVPPRKETLFHSRAGAEKKGEPLKFLEVQGAEAIHRASPTGTLGSVVVAVFTGSGTNTFDTRPLLERRLRGGVEAGNWPQRRYEPMLLPYQYR